MVLLTFGDLTWTRCWIMSNSYWRKKEESIRRGAHRRNRQLKVRKLPYICSFFTINKKDKHQPTYKYMEHKFVGVRKQKETKSSSIFVGNSEMLWIETIGFALVKSTLVSSSLLFPIMCVYYFFLLLRNQFRQIYSMFLSSTGCNDSLCCRAYNL